MNRLEARTKAGVMPVWRHAYRDSRRNYVVQNTTTNWPPSQSAVGAILGGPRCAHLSSAA